jgi:hypothetical protein
MRGALTATLCLIPLAVQAQDATTHHDHHIMEQSAPSQSDPPLKITINPEARVSVVMWGNLPPPVPCGTPADLPIKIINQGFVTSHLEAQLVGDAPPGTVLDFHPDPLKGIPEETRIMRVKLAKPGTTDLTIAFKAHHEIPDLGGRDRVHFLMQCR